MKALTPWTGMAGLRQEMDRLFDRFWETELPEWPGFGKWTPELDVAETKDALVVTAEIPGIEAKEIELSLHDQTLTIKGEKTQEKDERYYRMERAYGAFARTVRLPVPVEGSKVTATFKNGVLTVKLPKGPAAKGTTIPIKPE